MVGLSFFGGLLSVVVNFVVLSPPLFLSLLEGLFLLESPPWGLLPGVFSYLFIESKYKYQNTTRGDSQR